MKKSSLTLSIISTAFSAIALAILLFVPMTYNAFGANSTWDVMTQFGSGIGGTLAGIFTFSSVTSQIPFSLYFNVIFLILMVLLVLTWAIQLVMLIVHRRLASLAINILWLLFGAIDVAVLLMAVGLSSPGKGLVFENVVDGLYYHDLFGYINDVQPQGFTAVMVVLPYALAAVSFILGSLGIIFSSIDVSRAPGHPVVKEIDINKELAYEHSKEDVKIPTVTNRVFTDPASVSQSEEMLKAVQHGEFNDSEKMAEVTAEAKGDEPKSLLDAALQYRATTQFQQSTSSHNHQQAKTETPPTVIQNFYYGSSASSPSPFSFLAPSSSAPITRPEQAMPKVGFNPSGENSLTANDPHEIDKGSSDEKPVATSVSPSALSSDELRKMIREEVVSALSEKEAPTSASINADDVRLIVSEEIEKIKLPHNILSPDVVRNIVKEELVSFENVRDDSVKAQASINKSLTADEVSAKESFERQDKAITALQNSQLTAVSVRTIVADELEKKMSALSSYMSSQNSQKENHASPRSQDESSSSHSDSGSSDDDGDAAVGFSSIPSLTGAKTKIIRVPFPTRLLAADMTLQNYYKELKNEALSYGLKSRLSNSGDTFRLHAKTYLKIMVAGKGLKLYLALKPDDYSTSPIPLRDAGGKNIYRDIPAVFKVKSPLSLKRAKQLIADACENDSLRSIPVSPSDYLSELKAYKPQLAGSGDTLEED